MLRRNKSSRALPRPGGVSLRRHRRARGGCAPAVELMYRRSSPSARRPVREVSSIGFWFVGTEAAWGLAVVWRMELQIQSSCGGSGRRQWICLQDLRSSGRVPGRWMCSASFSSSTTMGVYCGSSKLHCDGVPADMGLEAIVLDVGRRCRRWRNLASKGSRGFFVIVLFYKGLCASSLVVQLSSVFYQNVPVSVLVFVRYLYG